MDGRPVSAEELFLAELRERLFAHFVGGCWRVPLADRHLSAPPGNEKPGAGGALAGLGRIVCAGADDIARARAGIGGDCAAPAAFHAALAERAGMLERLRQVEGGPVAPEGFAVPDALPALPESGRAWVLLSVAGMPAPDLAALLIAGARAGGMIWKPAPRAAASAHLLMEALGPLAGGRLAMVQGDHATGALLAQEGALIWASPTPAPPDLPVPLLSLRPRAPGRR